jgi:hypothetical protein
MPYEKPCLVPSPPTHVLPVGHAIVWYVVEACSMKIRGKSFTTAQLTGKLLTVAAAFGSWVLPIFVLLVLFATVALLTQGHHPFVQRLYTYF